MASNRLPHFSQERQRPFVNSSVGLLAAENQKTNPFIFAGATACPLLLLITYVVILRAFKA